MIKGFGWFGKGVIALITVGLVCAIVEELTGWVIIPGMAESSELEQNLAAVNDSTPFTDAELAKFDAIRKELGTQFCRRCGYCAPCSVGIVIPNMFVFEGYLERYGLGDWAKMRYAGMAKKAGDCIGCGACEARCPYQLPIREMLARVKEEFGA